MTTAMYKLCVLGDGGVGKTALTIQLCQNHFVEEYDPTIEDSYRKQVRIDEKPCVLEILDTAGQEEFTALRDQWIREGEGFIIVYSITSKSSFNQVSSFHRQMCQVKEEKFSTKIPLIVVGNKCDLEGEREVPTHEGKLLAESLGGGFYETSAKFRQNVDEIFYSLVRSIRASTEKASPAPSLKVKKTKKKWLKRCKII
eukprot:TRINITY_DN3088_c0_g1_i2.p1 TRINITY_DN3088_c0_g1~~TRINITY_DN3088_c0_g1_i2.p1  ORF type:complete len:209 (-),score=39.28 TRINITY_DN3088_c0_g1_i2:26-622(-)